MAMGLALGRERIWRAVLVSVLHIVGAALGGAVVGGLLGWLGSLLSLPVWRSELIIAAAIFALWQSLSRHPTTLGLHRQVPRVWERTMSPEPRFFLWGVLLGSGIATVIPYSAFLILLTTQLTSGIILGCVSGALFGGTREAVALLPLLGKRNRLHPEDLPRFLPSLKTRVQQLNILWILIGSALLVLTSWH